VPLGSGGGADPGSDGGSDTASGGGEASSAGEGSTDGTGGLAVLAGGDGRGFSSGAVARGFRKANHHHHLEKARGFSPSLRN
jgi:hypothetical protein